MLLSARGRARRALLFALLAPAAVVWLVLVPREPSRRLLVATPSSGGSSSPSRTLPPSSRPSPTATTVAAAPSSFALCEPVYQPFVWPNTFATAFVVLDPVEAKLEIVSPDLKRVSGTPAVRVGNTSLTCMRSVSLVRCVLPPREAALGLLLRAEFKMSGGAGLATAELRPDCVVRPPEATAELPPLALCTMTHNEETEVVEWIEYHRRRGVGHFYFYLHGSDDRTREVLLTYPRWLVTVYNFSGGNYYRWIPDQLIAQNDCLLRHQLQHRWIGIADVDEYFWPVNATFDDLPSLLAALWNPNVCGYFFAWDAFSSRPTYPLGSFPRIDSSGRPWLSVDLFRSHMPQPLPRDGSSGKNVVAPRLLRSYRVHMADCTEGGIAGVGPHRVVLAHFKREVNYNPELHDLCRQRPAAPRARVWPTDPARMCHSGLQRFAPELRAAVAAWLAEHPSLANASKERWVEQNRKCFETGALRPWLPDA